MMNGEAILFGAYGGVIVVTAVVIFTTLSILRQPKSKGVIQLNNEVTQPQKSPVPIEYKKGEAVQEKVSSPRKRRSALVALRKKNASRGNNISLPQQPVDALPAKKERLSMLPPAVSRPQPEINTVPLPPPDQEQPAVETMAPTKTKESETDTLKDLLQEVPEESDETARIEPRKQKHPIGGELSDLFTAEVEEEDDISKFAENLDDINTNNLLEETQDLINQLKGIK